MGSLFLGLDGWALKLQKVTLSFDKLRWQRWSASFFTASEAFARRSMKMRRQSTVRRRMQCEEAMCELYCNCVHFINLHFKLLSRGRGVDWKRCWLSPIAERGQFRPCQHENFEKFEMISTPTGSWIRSRRRPHQLPVGVEIISNFSKFSCWQGRNCPHSRWGLTYVLTRGGTDRSTTKVNLNYEKFDDFGQVCRVRSQMWQTGRNRHLLLQYLKWFWQHSTLHQDLI